MSFHPWFLLILSSTLLPAQTTQRLYLSGKGPSDAIEWDFTVNAGRRAREHAKIPVPSQWEQHGFGGYDYGHVPLKERNKEDGLYRRQFTVPADWKGKTIRIVFEGSMTDTTVTINGQQAGPTHQGGFYRFHHDITDKVEFGTPSQLEVLVSKDSANPSVEQAERKADYWIFGGIYRPVWIEALPPQFIDWSSTDARANGSLRARVHLGGSGDADKLVARLTTLAGEQVGGLVTAPVTGNGPVDLSANFTRIHPWSAEDPHLYQIHFTLLRDSQTLHRTTERIGFRTFEARPGKGVFVNGRRITIKGVNRHSFRPESGRSLDPEHCYEDVRLLKSMNMNSVRCSHYPPDKAFLEACDELGLYVIDELCTWQKPCLDTPTATRLIHQIVRRDANHPSILWWANGNEGGWNTEVDGEFPRWDIQQRPVLHPWDPFSGFQTKHYPDWKRLNADLAGDLLVMPTELLHGLYDGGHGAGLEDYWNAITARPNGLGGFLWVMADEGIMRTDRDGAIDTWETNAPDGIVGPHHEKEASFFTIQDIFCPVQIPVHTLPADFDGKIEVHNRYDFRNLSSVSFEWRLVGRFGGGFGGDFVFPGAEVDPPKRFKLLNVTATPGGSATLHLPLDDDWKDRESLELVATDSDDRHLWTWSWATRPAGSPAWPQAGGGKPLPTPKLSTESKRITVQSGNGTTFHLDASTGRILSASTGNTTIPLTNGPRIVGSNETSLPFTPVRIAKATANDSEKPNKPGNAIDGNLATRWSQQGRKSWLLLELKEPAEIDTLAIAWQKADERKASYALELSTDGKEWTEVLRSESRPKQTPFDVRHFDKRTARIARLRCLGNNKNTWNSILEVKLGAKGNTVGTGAKVTHRMEGDCVVIETTSASSLRKFTWTIHPDGRLDLAYRYKLDTAAPFHGLTFDLPEKELRSFSWLGQGPRRVWRNRMRGIRFGRFEIPFKTLEPSHQFDYPHARGYFAGIHQATVTTASGRLEITTHQPDTFLRVGTNDEGERIRTYWPEGDLSILHGIPAIGTKFKPPEALGPQSQFNPAPGIVTGKATLRFLD